MLYILFKLILTQDNVVSSLTDTGTPEEFGNGDFTEKIYQMFFFHITQEELKSATISLILDLRLRKTRSGKSRDYNDIIVFEKLHF